MTAATETPQPIDDDGTWECENPEPVDDEPWVTDPECGNCGHKMSCCTDNHYLCECDDDEDDFL